MAQPEAADGPGRDELLVSLRELERRMARIERSLQLPAEDALSSAAPPDPKSGLASAVAPSLLPLIGCSLVGLAGAYLLRALVEGEAIPPVVGVGAGLLYAMGWLVWAARTPADRRLASAVASLTSVLILSPLLWEATLKFHAVSTGAAGGILLLFTVFGLAISWRKNLLVTATISTWAGIGAAAALLVATHDALPFTFVLLAMAAAVEICACMDHWLSERWLAAAAADLSVLLATWLVTNGRGLPPAYAPIAQHWLLAAQASLAAIYLASVIFRTLVRGRTFTSFETAQCAAAILIGVGGGLRLSGEGPIIAAMALTCAAACYGVAFARLEHGRFRNRNFYTYSTFGLLLALAGSRILLATPAAAAVWAALAVAFVWAGGRFARITLDVHAGAYLVLALSASGALRQAADYMLGTGLPATLSAPLWAGGVAAAACYLPMIWRAASPGGRTAWLCRLTLAYSLAWLAAGVAAYAAVAGYHAVFGLQASHAYCATLRTVVLILGALSAAWAGSRWNNRELSNLLYPLMALGAYRLLAEDLHQERKAALFLSLLAYGAALTALPRIGRRRASQSGD